MVPIADTLGTGSAAPLPVTVTSEDLATGEEVSWRDSVITYSDGSIGHVFLADTRPAYGSQQIFRLVDEDGGEAAALITVPPQIEPIRQATTFTGGVRYPIVWIDAPQINNLRATYTIENERCETSRVTRRLPTNVAAPTEFGWTLRLPFSDEGREIRLSQANPDLSVREIVLSVEIASEDWQPPGGTFDPEILVEPGTLSNVRGGFGFIGSAYSQEIRWEPTPTELSSAGFRPLRFGCFGLASCMTGSAMPSPPRARPRTGTRSTNPRRRSPRSKRHSSGSGTSLCGSATCRRCWRRWRAVRWTWTLPSTSRRATGAGIARRTRPSSWSWRASPASVPTPSRCPSRWTRR